MTTDELRDQTTGWLGGEVEHWKRLFRAAEVVVIHQRAAIERVRELHAPLDVRAAAEAETPPACSTCRASWPCPTLRALDGAQ